MKIDLRVAELGALNGGQQFINMARLLFYIEIKVFI